MKREFLPGDDSHLELIKEDDYERIVIANPDMLRHPDYVREASHSTRDIAFKEILEEVVEQ